MKELQQKIFTFHDENGNEITLSNNPIFIKVGNTLIPIAKIFEKHTISNSNIKGYSFLEFAKISKKIVIFEGQELEFYDKNKKQVFLSKMTTPFIQWNDINDGISERYTVFKSILCPSAATLFQSSKYADLETKQGYKIVEFEHKNETYLLAIHDKKSAYLFKIDNNIDLLIDNELNEVDTTNMTKGFKSGFDFDFIYGIDTGKVTAL